MTQVPVYRGCAEPLVAHKRHAGDFHGKDGLGDSPDPDAPGLDAVQEGKAAEAIIKMVNDNPGEVGQSLALKYISTETPEDHEDLFPEVAFL